ncbi:LysR family transcriptional regulator [Phyllobacterium sp. SB3]|uniref:LysR family transcriptional regulator n=1 Tax=Phyllobacterium sp. SB3 TaxID=3156073 RepID=UPI0032AF0722
MKTFVRVAELGTLSAAARELALTQPAVSQQIAALERHLGIRLFHRSTRQLVLSEGAETYYRHVQEILQAVDEAEESAGIYSTALQGSLRIHAPVGFGQMHLAPLVMDFQRRHPVLRIELVLDDRIADLITDNVDVAIRFGAMKSSDLVARKLGSFQRILVASPEYIAVHGSPTVPDELSRHGYVRFIWSPQGEIASLIGPDGPIDVAINSVFLANNAFVLNEALCAGLGVGAVQLPLVQGLIDSGKLIRILPDYAYAPMDIHAVYASRRFLPRKTKIFIEHLIKEMKSISGLQMIRMPESGV